MFEKLFLLVKNNADAALNDSPAITEKNREAVLNDASSSIIEVLKNQVEGARLKDMVKYFQFSGVFNNPLITSAVNKFANKLNNFYSIGSDEAMDISHKLITPVMQEMIRQSKSDQNKEFALGAIIKKLNGNIGDMSLLLNQLKIA